MPSLRSGLVHSESDLVTAGFHVVLARSSETILVFYAIILFYAAETIQSSAVKDCGNDSMNRDNGGAV